MRKPNIKEISINISVHSLPNTRLEQSVLDKKTEVIKTCINILIEIEYLNDI